MPLNEKFLILLNIKINIYFYQVAKKKMFQIADGGEDINGKRVALALFAACKTQR